MKIGQREIYITGYCFNKGTISKYNQVSLEVNDETDDYIKSKLKKLDYIGEIQIREAEDVNISFSINNENYDANGDEKLKILTIIAEKLTLKKLEIIPTMLSHTYFSKCENAYNTALYTAKKANIEIEEGDEFTFDPDANIEIDEFRYTEFIDNGTLLKRTKSKKRVKTK